MSAAAASTFETRRSSAAGPVDEFSKYLQRINTMKRMKKRSRVRRTKTAKITYQPTSLLSICPHITYLRRIDICFCELGERRQCVRCDFSRDIVESQGPKVSPGPAVVVMAVITTISGGDGGGSDKSNKLVVEGGINNKSKSGE